MPETCKQCGGEAGHDEIDCKNTQLIALRDENEKLQGRVRVVEEQNDAVLGENEELKAALRDVVENWEISDGQQASFEELLGKDE